MKTLLTTLPLLFVALACQAKTGATPGAVDPQPRREEPTSEADGTVPVEEAKTARIQAGGWPLSNAHRFGSRSYELRRTEGGVLIRLHDVISFQGVGMKPEDMAAPHHACTPWEPLPADLAGGVFTKQTALAPDASLACDELGDTCRAIHAWYQSTGKPRIDAADPSLAFQSDQLIGNHGRGSEPCS
jgi:hypothetical protein